MLKQQAAVHDETIARKSWASRYAATWQLIATHMHM
jgi:hypothetical protein